MNWKKTIKNETIIEDDKEKKSRKYNMENHEYVPEEVPCTKTPSIESSVKLPKLLPLAIRNKNAITQGIATTVNLNKKSIVIVCFNKKMCVEKRNI